MLGFIKTHAFTLIAVLLGTVMGCAALFPVKTPSPVDGKTKLTHAQLDAEVSAFAAKVEAAYTDLGQQEEMRRQIITWAGGVVGHIPGIPPDLLTGILGVATIGLGADKAVSLTRKKK
jgi:hypothetical protein